MTADRALTWLLRLIGGIELLAIPFILLPFAWMATIHERLLGLGPLPSAAVVEYLARGLSAMYAVHGAVLVFVSTDTRRYRPLIRFLGYWHTAFGAAVIAIDAAAGLPWWWILGEGPGVVMGGVLVLVLSRERPAA